MEAMLESEQDSASAERAAVVDAQTATGCNKSGIAIRLSKLRGGTELEQFRAAKALLQIANAKQFFRAAPVQETIKENL